MNLLALVPVRDWLYLSAIALAIAGGALFVHHERAIGAHKAEAQLQRERAAVAAVAASAAQASAQESTRRETALQEIARAAQANTLKIAAAATVDASDRRAFGLQLDAYLRASAAGQNPGPAASSPATADAVLVLARLLERVDARAADLAQLADQRGAAGQACVSAYAALTPAQ